MDTYNGDVHFDDWLPALKRSATWNGWSDTETLMQLAGHLRGRALEEWNLMDESDKTDLSQATTALKRRLDPGSKTLAAQDLRRASQGQDELISNYVRRLEKMFRMAYGRDGISAETRDALLFSQMQEGLKYELMESPAVSGATEYKQLFGAARNEEKRLADLEKQRRFLNRPQPVTILNSRTDPPSKKYGVNPMGARETDGVTSAGYQVT